MTNLFLGLRTAKYSVADLGTAKAWYTEVFDHGPHLTLGG